MNGILELTPSGLYCSYGDFYIDPVRPVKRSVITHAHADHARWGCQSYLCAQDSKALLRARLGREANIETLGFGEVLAVNAVKISLSRTGPERLLPGGCVFGATAAADPWIGDLDETITLLLPRAPATSSRPLHEWVERILLAAAEDGTGKPAQRNPERLE